MHVYSETSFDELTLTCPSCNWNGTGYGVNIIDFYGMSKLKEVRCPKCDQFLGNLENRHKKLKGELGDQLSNQFG